LDESFPEDAARGAGKDGADAANGERASSETFFFLHSEVPAYKNAVIIK
jgi:hypothetical protein